MAYKIQLRKGTATEWSTANPILASGEIGVDLTNSELRVGNGTDTWSSLSPIGAGAGGAADASSVSILDSLGFYTSESVEGALTEIAQILTEYNANLIPDTDATYDLGSVDNRWDNAYIADSALVGDILLSENVITPLGGNTEYDDKAKIIVDGNLLVSGDIENLAYNSTDAPVYTVGESGDYSTINEALIDISKKYTQHLDPQSAVLRKYNVYVELKLKSGFILEEPIVADSIDLGWITITSEDSDVYYTINRIDSSTWQGAFAQFPWAESQGGFVYMAGISIGAINGGVCPTLDLSLKPSPETNAGLYIGIFGNKSSLVIKDYNTIDFYNGSASAAKGASFTFNNCILYHCFSLSATNGTIYGEYSTINYGTPGHYMYGVSLSNFSKAYLRGVTFMNYPKVYMISNNSYVESSNAIVSDCWSEESEPTISISNNSDMDATWMSIGEASSNARILRASSNSRVNVSYSLFSSNTTITMLTSDGAMVNVSGALSVNQMTGVPAVEVLNGGIIRFPDLSSVGVIANVAVNTVTSDGIVFN